MSAMTAARTPASTTAMTPRPTRRRTTTRTTATSISNDGGSRRQGNEPFTVVDPTNPDFIAAGLERLLPDRPRRRLAGLRLLARRGRDLDRLDRARLPAWTRRTRAWPRRCSAPTPTRATRSRAFDNDGNLFVGGIAFNRVKPSNGDVYVATYGTDPHASGFPVDYQRTRGRRQGHAVRGHRRHLPGQADARSRPNRWRARRQRVCVLVPLHGRRRPEQGLLQPLDRFGRDVLEADRDFTLERGQVDPGLRHRHRGRRRRLRDVPHVHLEPELPERSRVRPIDRRRRKLLDRRS